MRNTLRLLLFVAEASLLTITVYFALVLAAAPGLLKSDVPRSAQGVAVVLTVILPIGAAAWWIFRKLCPEYPRREARATAIAFGLFTPISLLIAALFAQIPGGYAGFLGRPFGLIGAFLGMVVMTTVLSFVPTVLALWITRRIGRLDQAQ